MWRRRDEPAQPPAPVQLPVSAENVMSRLDSVVDRLEGVYERLAQSLEEAHLSRARGDREDD